MRSVFWFITLCILIIYTSCKKENKIVSDNLILIKGGVFVSNKSNLYNTKAFVRDFYIGKHEVTQNEWIEIMGTNPSKFVNKNHPVEMVSWYDCVEYCIKKSLKEGLKPYYKIFKDSIDSFNKSEFDTIKWLVKINPSANGYRLPTEIEWEYAASGGQQSKHFIYSGSNNVDNVAWYWRNCGDTLLTQHWDYAIIEKNNGRTHPVGTKKPNELGLYDMTGNVREWCGDWYEDDGIVPGRFRAQRGGGWIGIEVWSKNKDRGYFEASGVGPDQGFRVCRNGN